MGGANPSAERSGQDLQSSTAKRAFSTRRAARTWNVRANLQSPLDCFMWLIQTVLGLHLSRRPFGRGSRFDSHNFETNALTLRKPWRAKAQPLRQTASGDFLNRAGDSGKSRRRFKRIAQAILKTMQAILAHKKTPGARPGVWPLLRAGLDVRPPGWSGWSHPVSILLGAGLETSAQPPRRGKPPAQPRRGLHLPSRRDTGAGVAGGAREIARLSTWKPLRG